MNKFVLQSNTHSQTHSLTKLSFFSVFMLNMFLFDSFSILSLTQSVNHGCNLIYITHIAFISLPVFFVCTFVCIKFFSVFLFITLLSILSLIQNVGILQLLSTHPSGLPDGHRHRDHRSHGNDHRKLGQALNHEQDHNIRKIKLICGFCDIFGGFMMHEKYNISKSFNF